MSPSQIRELCETCFAIISGRWFRTRTGLKRGPRIHAGTQVMVHVTRAGFKTTSHSMKTRDLTERKLSFGIASRHFQEPRIGLKVASFILQHRE
jgi:hypothetical protein